MTDGGTSESEREQEELWPDNPFSVPRIKCGRCGEDHHIDAAIGEFQGRCHDCFAFLRRPTFEEEQEFGKFIAWNGERMERELHTDSSQGADP